MQEREREGVAELRGRIERFAPTDTGPLTELTTMLSGLRMPGTTFADAADIAQAAVGELAVPDVASTAVTTNRLTGVRRASTIRSAQDRRGAGGRPGARRALALTTRVGHRARSRCAQLARCVPRPAALRLSRGRPCRTSVRTWGTPRRYGCGWRSVPAGCASCSPGRATGRAEPLRIRGGAWSAVLAHQRQEPFEGVARLGCLMLHFATIRAGRDCDPLLGPGLWGHARRGTSKAAQLPPRRQGSCGIGPGAGEVGWIERTWTSA